MKQAIITILLSFFLINSYAGRPCENSTLETPEKLSFVSNIAEKINTSLKQKNVKVALIARVGQDLSKYNLKYSHVGFIYKDEQGYSVIHELNTCGTADSALYSQGLGNFFLDDPFTYETMTYVPSVELQNRLYEMLTKEKFKAFHEKKYNMLSFPFSIKYQNSNQFVLEALASVMSREIEILDRSSAQTWLKLVGYEPSTLNIDAVTRLGARITKANIAFDDQPFDRRMAGLIDTVTVDSIFKFMEKKDKTGYFIHLLGDSKK